MRPRPRAAITAACGTTVLMGLLLPGEPGAAELRDIVVDYEDGTYFVDSKVWFDAPQPVVYDVFADWDVSEQFSSVVVEARNTGPDEHGRRGYYVRNRACVLFFCKSTERTGSVEAKAPAWLTASADPAASDFKMSEERWHFEPEDGGTLVSYSLRMRPDFWIPPLIGPYVIKQKLRSEGAEVVDRIEKIARDRAGVTGPGEANRIGQGGGPGRDVRHTG